MCVTTKHRHQSYCFTPISVIRKYYKIRPFSSLTLHGMSKQIIRGGGACCSAAHDIDVQQSASQTGAILNQNCTRNRGDSRTSGNSKDTHKCARKDGLIPDHVRLALLLPTIRRIHSGTQTHGLLDHSPVTYSCGRCRRLHRETRAVARSWEQQQVQKGLTLMPKHVHHRSDYPHQSQDRHERTTMEK